MNAHWSRIAVIALLGLALSGCSAGDTGGTIEMALTETCVEGTDPQCVVVEGEAVRQPSAFEQAEVQRAVRSQAQENAIEITFSPEGADVLEDLTRKAVEAGTDSRVVLRVGGELVAAVVVMEPLEDAEVMISFGPDRDPEELLDRIRSS
ncbi:hypothetical protein MHM582_2983 [Microbacterium sp. HM58-2]|nr:hypothetical protein MHM582_2983 [Microbacterium sp. HM58-2]